ncbi:MAG: tetratricopeptide repeat protein [Isosphaeraceae bacterium]
MSALDARSLVQRGWDHLRAQRPLAAWASWQRAIRLNPGDEAATKALELLAGSSELPAAARAEYRFQTPDDPRHRERWNRRLQGQGLDELDAARAAFADLADDDPIDHVARLNLALCLAWLGRNREAVATLEQAVRLLATTDFDQASQCWTLAEVLRHGGGAEAIADDLRHVWVVDPPASSALTEGVIRRWPNLREVAVPRDPISGGPALSDGRVFEWLDRPGIDPSAGAPARPEGLPRVLATVIVAPGSFRLSTPDPAGLAALDDPPLAEVAAILLEGRREATPLPLAWSDAAIGTFRFPEGVDESIKRTLARSAVEHYYENLWIHQPRHGLDGRTPLDASTGDAADLAKLAGVVRFREQLGQRSTHAALYQGYPFDRLRRRLGLIGPADSAVLDAADVTCMSGRELDALDGSELAGPRLVDAVASAQGLRDDSRVFRLARAWLRGRPEGFEGLDAGAVIASLVRHALREGSHGDALAILTQARELARDDPHSQRTFMVWTAEILARAGRSAESLEIYREILANVGGSAGARLAFDGAETLLDLGHDDQAVPLLQVAREMALAAEDSFLLSRAETLLSRP